MPIGVVTIGATPGTGANFEDLQEVITMLSPDETPFLATIGRTEAKDHTHAWLTDALAAASSAGLAQGADFVTSTMTGRTRHKSYTQIFGKGVSVTNTQRASNPAGVDDEYKWQIMKKARETVLNMEYRCFAPSGAYQSATSDIALAYMKTLSDLITANHPMRGAVINGVASASATCATVWTEKRLNNALQRVYTNGASVDVIIGAMAVKRQIAKITGGSNQRRNIAAADRAVITSVDVYESPAGLVELMLERQIRMPTHTAALSASVYGQTYFIERGMAAWATLRPTKHVPLPPTGDSTRGQVLGEGCLEYGHPAGGLRVWGTKNIGNE